MTNSGKLVYSILGKEEKSSNLTDFSKFPNEAEKINNICLEQISSCGFNNVVSAYYSKSNMASEFNIDDISLLRGKNVVYSIIMDNGKWYFGHSTDFGERINTWLKDCRGAEKSKDRERKKEYGKNELCKDARKYERMLFTCLVICDTEEEAIDKENELIVNFVEERFKEITNGENPSHYTWREIISCVQPYIYNKIKAKANY